MQCSIVTYSSSPRTGSLTYSILNLHSSRKGTWRNALPGRPTSAHFLWSTWISALLHVLVSLHAKGQALYEYTTEETKCLHTRRRPTKAQCIGMTLHGSVILSLIAYLINPLSHDLSTNSLTSYSKGKWETLIRYHFACTVDIVHCPWYIWFLKFDFFSLWFQLLDLVTESWKQIGHLVHWPCCTAHFQSSYCIIMWCQPTYMLQYCTVQNELLAYSLTFVPRPIDQQSYHYSITLRESEGPWSVGR